MKAFVEELRYIYDLTPDSLVIDAGCYEGNWALEISGRYHCNIWCYEPHPIFAHNCRVSLKDCPKAMVVNAGLGDSDREETFGVSNDSTGLFNRNEDERRRVKIMDVAQVALGIDLMKLNIEGMEYEVIERLIGVGRMTQIKNLQVQFHMNFVGALERYEGIRKILLQTHEPEWDSEPVWQNWKLR